MDLDATSAKASRQEISEVYINGFAPKHIYIIIESTEVSLILLSTFDKQRKYFDHAYFVQVTLYRNSVILSL